MSRSVLTAVAWPYANGPRHIGHVAGFGVPSDVFSRYCRMRGDRVLMVSGTDEHGTPILVGGKPASMGALLVLDGAGHATPTERPRELAALLASTAG